MKQEKSLATITLLLSFVAGFCDTVTFVAAGELFSAHVTGNFIVFAYDVIKHADGHGWQKLITFPVFIISVMISGVIGRKSGSKFTLLLLESGLLLISGLASLLIRNSAFSGQWQLQVVAMVIVVAMGFQNTFGKLFNKAIYGLTTVMTGNVTQAALDLTKIVGGRPIDPDALVSLKKQLILISGFFFGCLSGALLAGRFGMISIVIPGLLLILWLVKNNLIVSRTRSDEI